MKSKEKDEIGVEETKQDNEPIPFNEKNNDEDALNAGNRRKKIFIAFGVLVAIVICLCIFAGQWNSIMAEKSCKAGNYPEAIKHYEADLNKGKSLSDTERIQYGALSVYLSAIDAYNSDDMATLSKSLDTLKNSRSAYPTKAEREDLQKKYSARSEEINSFDSSIQDIFKLFEDPNGISQISEKCDELLKKPVLKTQKTELENMKKVSEEYVKLKEAYSKEDYESAMNIINNIPEIYKEYAVKEEIDKLKENIQKAINDRALIDATWAEARDFMKKEEYENALKRLNELLEMDIKPEEKKEAEELKASVEKTLHDIDREEEEKLMS